jgi:hypothetical protein
LLERLLRLLNDVNVRCAGGGVSEDKQ